MQPVDSSISPDPPRSAAPPIGGGGTGIDAVLNQLIQSNKNLDTALQQREKQSAADQANLKAAYSRVPPLNLQPLQAKPKWGSPDLMQAFGQPAAILAIFGSLLTRRPMTNAIAAAGAALKGYADGNQQAYDRAEQDWKDNLELALEQNRMEIERYRAAMEGPDIQSAQAEVLAHATEFKDKVTIDNAKAGNTSAMIQIWDARARMAQAAQQHLDTVQHQRTMEKIAQQNADALAGWRSSQHEIQLKRIDMAATALKNRGFPENQSNAASFAIRMFNDEKILADLTDKGVETGTVMQYIASDPSTTAGLVAQGLLTADQQLYLQASQDWTLAFERKYSGAAIGEREGKRDFATYFPMPGDTSEVIAQKTKIRGNIAQGMKISAGPAFDAVSSLAAGLSTGPEAPPPNADMLYFDATGEQTDAPSQ